MSNNFNNTTHQTHQQEPIPFIDHTWLNNIPYNNNKVKPTINNNNNLSPSRKHSYSKLFLSTDIDDDTSIPYIPKTTSYNNSTSITFNSMMPSLSATNHFNHINPPLQTTPLSTNNSIFNFTTKSNSQNICYQNTLDLSIYKINILNILNKSETRTTVRLKFIPKKLTEKELVDEIDNVLGTNYSFRTYDCIYLPTSAKKEKENLGYTFINFTDSLYVIDFYYKSKNLNWKRLKQKKEKPSFSKFQGKEELINNPEKTIEYKKPLVFDTDYSHDNKSKYKITIKQKYKNEVIKYQDVNQFIFI